MTGIWGTARGQRHDPRSRRHPGDRHGFRRSRLQFLESEVHVRHTAVAADPDRHRSAGDRQDLSGRSRYRGRCESDAAGADRHARARSLVQQIGRGARGRRARASASGWERAGGDASRMPGKPIHPARLLAEISEAAPDGRDLRHRCRLEQERRGPAVASVARPARSSQPAAWRRWASRRRRRSARSWARRIAR